MESRRLMLSLLVALFLTVSCGDDDGTSPPETGSIEVTAATTGDDVDPDGYAVRVGTASQSLGVNASTMFGGVATGEREAELTGVATNCAVAGANPRTVTIAAGEVASTSFDVTWVAVLQDQIAFSNPATATSRSM